MFSMNVASEALESKRRREIQRASAHRPRQAPEVRQLRSEGRPYRNRQTCEPTQRPPPGSKIGTFDSERAANIGEECTSEICVARGLPAATVRLAVLLHCRRQSLLPRPWRMVPSVTTASEIRQPPRIEINSRKVETETPTRVSCKSNRLSFYHSGSPHRWVGFGSVRRRHLWTMTCKKRGRH
jgi:hypothetical protein